MLLSSISEKYAVVIGTALNIGKPKGAIIPANDDMCHYVITDDMHIFALDNMFANGDIVTVNSTLDQVPLGIKLHLGDELYTVYGKRLGICKDINMHKTGITILTEERKISGSKIVSATNGIILVNPKKGCRKEVKELPVTPTLITLPQADDDSVTTLVSEAQADTASDYSFMIGKRLKNEVSDITRSFVLMAGTIITDRVIQNAKRAGKLTELYNNIK